jgi:hypothetical protein
MSGFDSHFRWIGLFSWTKQQSVVELIIAAMRDQFLGRACSCAASVIAESDTLGSACDFMITGFATTISIHRIA